VHRFVAFVRVEVRRGMLSSRLAPTASWSRSRGKKGGERGGSGMGALGGGGGGGSVGVRSVKEGGSDADKGAEAAVGRATWRTRAGEEGGVQLGWAAAGSFAMGRV
jgi:hypothetical protein